MNIKIPRIKFMALMLNILYFITAIIILSVEEKIWVVSFSILAFISLISNVYFAKKLNKTFFNFFTIFYVVVFILHISQIVLVLVNDNSWQNIFKYFPTGATIKAFTYSFECIEMMTITYLIFQKRKEINDEKKFLLSKSELFVTKFLFYFFYIFKVYSMIRMYSASINGGYLSGLAEMSSVDQLINSFANTFCILYLIYVNNNKKRKLIFTICIIVEMFGMLSGSRLYSICYILLLLYIVVPLINVDKNGDRKKRKKTNIIMLIIFSIMLLSFIVGIKDLRDHNENITFGSIIKASISNNILIEATKELGGTQIDTITAINYSESINFSYGKLYGESLITIIPNIGGFYSNVLHELYFIYGLQDVFYWNYGGSIVAESFINFGYYGGIVFIVLGFILAKIEKKFINLRSIKPIYSIYIVAICYRILLWSRGYFFGILRIPIWILVMFIVINKILIKRNINRGESNNE